MTGSRCSAASAGLSPMWWMYLIAGFVGGVLVLGAFIAALSILAKSGNMLSVHFGGKDVEYYKDIELIESDVRPGGIYVKYRNFGQKEATTACFKIKVFDNEGRLIAESEEAAYETIPPGSIQENVIVSHQLEDEWIHSQENRIEVRFRYGYIE